MTRRQSVLGALFLSALCLCAFAVAGASAATLYACQEVKEGTGKWADSKCEVAKVGGGFGTVATALNTQTLVNGTATASTTLGIFTPVHEDIVCEKLTTAGATMNQEPVPGTMLNTGQEISFKFSSCKFKKEIGCKVKGGGYEFPNLVSTTFLTGSGETRVKFTPAKGTVLGEIFLEGCGLESPITVSGALIGIPSGPALSFTEESSVEGKLNWGGFSLKLTASTRLENTAGNLLMIE